jgi:hypothetical protein
MAFQRRSTRLEFPRIWSDGPFRHQRHRRGFWIPASSSVMGPLVSTEIAQPAPQARCIGFSPGEPCSQAFGIGRTETAVGHSLALSVSGIMPAITDCSYLEQRNTFGDRLGPSGIPVSIVAQRGNPWLAEEECSPLPAIPIGRNGRQTTSMPSASGPFCPAFSVKRTRWFSRSVLNPARSTARMWTNTSFPP